MHKMPAWQNATDLKYDATRAPLQFVFLTRFFGEVRADSNVDWLAPDLPANKDQGDRADRRAGDRSDEVVARLPVKQIVQHKPDEDRAADPEQSRVQATLRLVSAAWDNRLGQHPCDKTDQDQPDPVRHASWTMKG